MTFQQLYYLLEVEKTGSFSQAAKKLFVTQSTISNAIASLEKEVGSPIFVRGKKALSLTLTGEEVIAHAKRICESHKYITTGERSQNPKLRIGSNNFAPVRAAFVQMVEENQDKSDIEFIYHDGRNKNFEDELLSYRMDVAVSMFINFHTAQKEDHLRKKGLHYEKLITLPGAICIGPGHRLYDVPEFSIDELKDDRFIELPSKSVSKQYLPPSSVKSIGTTHPGARRELLYRGLGYSLTYMHSAEERAVSPIRYVPVPGLSYTFYVYYDRLHPMTPEVTRFLELLRMETEKYKL